MVNYQEDFKDMYDIALRLTGYTRPGADEIELILHANILLQREFTIRLEELSSEESDIGAKLDKMNLLGGVTGKLPIEVGINLAKILEEAKAVGEWMVCSHNSVREGARMLKERTNQDYGNNA